MVWCGKGNLSIAQLSAFGAGAANTINGTAVRLSSIPVRLATLLSNRQCTKVGQPNVRTEKSATPGVQRRSPFVH